MPPSRMAKEVGFLANPRVIAGGFLRAPTLVPTEEHDGEEYVKLTTAEDWLCQA